MATQGQISLQKAVSSGGAAVICPQCALTFGSSGAAGFLLNNGLATLGYCETCQKYLPTGYRPNYREYVVTVTLDYWLNTAAVRSDETLKYFVWCDLARTQESLNDRLAARNEMLTHHRAVVCSAVWLAMPFELWVYETYTSVNTPLPAFIMEFFTHDA